MLGDADLEREDKLMRFSPSTFIGLALIIGNVGTTSIFANPGDLLLTIPNPTPAASDLFGTRLAVVGNDIVATDFRDDVNGFDAGAAYLFDGQTGQLIRTFISPTAPVPKRFGGWVFAFEDRILALR